MLTATMKWSSFLIHFSYENGSICWLKLSASKKQSNFLIHLSSDNGQIPWLFKEVSSIHICNWEKVN